MKLEDYGDVWVCQDCYFAHHYGAYQREFEADDFGLVGPDGDDDLPGYVQLWYVGEGDEPVGGWHEIRHNHTLDHNREPLGLIEDSTGCEVCEADGELQVPCEQCGSADDENGIQEFSWSRCQGCGSPLGGGRYRLHLWMREEVTT